MVRRTNFKCYRQVSHAFAGVYALMFFTTTRIMIKKQAAESFASRVFLVAGSMNFVLATLHICQ